ncbi:radical SAM/SPASM domain-containing protein [Clostridium amazonitimonense]|uniref:radical SAM/SPASM domain-containing protein n=1 Tax=Clostridium amazonitimonense TaxID=1499689 RepID=UPI0005094775|nr:radical SAM protein [Clostridium amazonitimonense]
MKQSKYNTFFELDDLDQDKYVLYNTLHRKYLILNNEDKYLVESLLNNLERETFNLEETDYLKKLATIGSIIPNEYIELNQLKFLYNQYKFNNNVFHIILNPTLNCNFRCSYCYEEHKTESFNEEIMNRIIKLVERKSSEENKIQVAWFGGEPLLEFDKIKHLTDMFKNICSNNNCLYEAKIITNGYLLNDKNIKKLKDLNITNAQITLDGTKEYHDKKRHLQNGEGTYEKVKESCVNILKNDIKLTLRVNIDEENYEDISNLFNVIPDIYKKNVNFQASNLFQQKENLNFYLLYKKVIDSGFSFNDSSNRLIKCEAATPNAVTIYPDGKLTFCSLAAEEGNFFGNLDSDGRIKITNKELYYNFYSVDPFDTEICNDCIELPMCMGTCVFTRFKNKGKCTKTAGLSLQDRMKLHVYNDKHFKHVLK